MVRGYLVCFLIPLSKDIKFLPHEHSISKFQIGWGINIPDVDQVTVAANLRHYTIRGLKPNRDYVISLRAYNLMGNGFPIYETVRTTSIEFVPCGTGIFDSRNIPSNPNETPIGVRAETLSSSSIRVTWTDPKIEISYLRQYTIRYSSRWNSLSIFFHFQTWFLA